jgi:hypothetical protein
MNKSILQIAIVSFLIGQSLIGYGQIDSTSQNSSNAKLDSLESKITNLQKTLDVIKNIVANDTVTSLGIGTYCLFKTDSIPVYYFKTDIHKKQDCKICDTISWKRPLLWPFKRKYCNEKKLASFKINISKVKVEVSDGVVYDIQIKTKENKTFTNGLAPIEVNKFDERCDLLKYFDGNKYFYIQTCDFLDWTRQGNFTPNDISFDLTKTDTCKSLTKDVGINSVFNIKLYTDMLSAFGNEDNGLVQTEANFKAPLISSNIKNKPFFLLHYFTANFRLSKFDDKFKYTSVNYANNDSAFSRQTFHQRNWLNLDLGFNIFSGQFANKSKSGYAVDLIGGFALSNFANSNDSATFALPFWGFNPSIKIIPAPNFGINLSSQFIWQSAPQLKDKGYGQEKKIISPEIEMFWNPLSSPGNKIFARAKYVMMVGDYNPFWQVQFGYNLSLSEIINKKLENK